MEPDKLSPLRPLLEHPSFKDGRKDRVRPVARTFGCVALAVIAVGTVFGVVGVVVVKTAPCFRGSTSLEDASTPGQFLHISDIHIDPDYTAGASVSSGCRKSAADTGDGSNIITAGQWGNHECDTPAAVVDKVFEFASTEAAHVDFILYTGDDARHDSKLLDEQLWQALRMTTEYFTKYFPTKTVFPTVGNHDLNPADNMGAASSSPEWKEYFSRLAGLWEPWLDDGALATVKEGGYYSMKVPGRDNLRVISMSTMYFYKKNKVEGAGCKHESDLGSQHFRWLDKSLSAASEAGEKVYLIGHVWPKSSSWKGHCMDAYIDMVTNHSATIAGQFFGHTNTDEFHLVYPDRITHARHKGEHAYYKYFKTRPEHHEKEKTPVGSFYVAPSVYPKLNPGIRIWQFETDTSHPYYFTQYYEDIDRANRDGDFQLKKEYDLKHTYNVDKINPHSLYETIHSNKDYLAEYEKYKVVLKGFEAASDEDDEADDDDKTLDE